MRLYARLSVLLLVSFDFTSAQRPHERELECADRDGRSRAAWCDEPLGPVTTVVSAASYIVKLPCLDCPVSVESVTPIYSRNMTRAENDLLFNITLSRDARQLLLNEGAIFPSILPPFEYPTILSALQVNPSLSRTDLDISIACLIRCTGGFCPCRMPSYDSLYTHLDYDYSLVQVHSDKDAGWAEWQITLDAIGGEAGHHALSAWKFNNTEQEMVKIVLRGQESSESKLNRDSGTGSSLFDSGNTEFQPLYDLTIQSVELVERSYIFASLPPQSTFSKIKHFFGIDPADPAHHFVYLQSAWGWYAKKGTLKESLASILYDWRWDLVGIIGGATLAGLAGLFGLYRLVLLILEQRRLARWGGMDEVWAQIRAEPSGEPGSYNDEADYLIGGIYTDDVDDFEAGNSLRSPPPRYTDALQVNKPLPSKPLPDKPLPDVPLIDDV